MSLGAMEGVVRFEVERRAEPLPERSLDVLPSLLGWRAVLSRLGLIGAQPNRYGGLGFGNLSACLAHYGAPTGCRRFVVTGTQTSGKVVLDTRDFCVVAGYDTRANRVEAVGEATPSSESMTHGAVYDACPGARFVFHVHSPDLWHRRAQLGLPVTRAEVEYGTPAMAAEVANLVRRITTARGLLAMGGHEDGLVAYAPTADEAGALIMQALARSLA